MVESHFRQLCEEAPLPYQSLDSEGRLLEDNRAWEEMFGFKREEVLGKYIGDFQVPGQEERLRKAFIQCLHRDFVSAIEFEFSCKDGSRKLMSVSGRITRDAQDRFQRTHCILSDITERSAIEKASQDSMEATRVMQDILERLLDISKLDSGAISPDIRAFSIGALLNQLHDQYHAIARSNGLTLELMPCDAVVQSDPTLLRVILQNLISNAIKYTRRGNVVIECERRGNLLSIEVRDSGIGIPEAMEEVIFEEFYQLDNTPVIAVKEQVSDWQSSDEWQTS